MPTIRLTDQLVTPVDNIAISGAVFEFKALRYLNRTPTCSKSVVTTDVNGRYDIELGYGYYELTFRQQKNSPECSLGKVTVSDETTATTIQELIADSTPIPDENMRRFQEMLNELYGFLQYTGGRSLGAYNSSPAIELKEVYDYAYTSDGKQYSIRNQADLPYTIDAVAYPNPDSDPKLKQFSFLTNDLGGIPKGVTAKSRRGTTQEINAFTPEEGEVIVDTSTSSLVVGDGVKQGGHRQASEDFAKNTTYEQAGHPWVQGQTSVKDRIYNYQPSNGPVIKVYDPVGGNVLGSQPDFSVFSILNITPLVIGEYAKINYKSSDGNSAIENMFANNPIASTVGDILSTGGTSWEKISESEPVTIDNFRAINVINVTDCGVYMDDQSKRDGNSASFIYALELAKKKKTSIWIPAGTMFINKVEINLADYMYANESITNSTVGIIGSGSSETTIDMLDDGGPAIFLRTTANVSAWECRGFTFQSSLKDVNTKVSFINSERSNWIATSIITDLRVNYVDYCVRGHFWQTDMTNIESFRNKAFLVILEMTSSNLDRLYSRTGGGYFFGVDYDTDTKSTSPNGANNGISYTEMSNLACDNCTGALYTLGIMRAVSMSGVGVENPLGGGNNCYIELDNGGNAAAGTYNQTVSINTLTGFTDTDSPMEALIGVVGDSSINLTIDNSAWYSDKTKPVVKLVQNPTSIPPRINLDGLKCNRDALRIDQMQGNYTLSIRGTTVKFSDNVLVDPIQYTTKMRFDDVDGASGQAVTGVTLTDIYMKVNNGQEMRVPLANFIPHTNNFNITISQIDGGIRPSAVGSCVLIGTVAGNGYQQATLDYEKLGTFSGVDVSLRPSSDSQSLLPNAGELVIRNTGAVKLIFMGKIAHSSYLPYVVNTIDHG